MTMMNDDIYLETMHMILIGDPLHGGVVSEPSRILKHVYLGSQSNAEQLHLLRRIGVTDVLNCAGYRGHRSNYKSPYDGLGINYYEFQAEDSEHYNITQHFTEAFDFLNAVKRSGGIALVHCALGINRSAAVCLAYVMVDTGLPLLEVTRLLKKKRRILLSNKAFQRQLVMFARRKHLLDCLNTAPHSVNFSSDEMMAVVGAHRLPSPEESTLNYYASSSHGKYSRSSW